MNPVEQILNFWTGHKHSDALGFTESRQYNSRMCPPPVLLNDPY